MPLTAAEVLSIALSCAPSTAPPTLLAVAKVESGLEPLAIGSPAALRGPVARTRHEANLVARSLIAAGHDVDLGLAQINVRNLPRLGMTIEDAFDPCRNLKAASRILGEGYGRAAASLGPGQSALRVALSLYNTGHPARGFANGYVARVLAAAAAPGPVAATPSRPTEAATGAFVITLTEGPRP
jgi:type IV secretion system protein VirB1